MSSLAVPHHPYQAPAANMIRQQRLKEAEQADLSSPSENQDDDEFSRVVTAVEVDMEEHNGGNEANDKASSTPLARSARRRLSRKTFSLSGRNRHRENEYRHGAENDDMEQGAENGREDSDYEPQTHTTQQAKPRGGRRLSKRSQSDRPVRARAFSCFESSGKEQERRVAIVNRLYEIWGDDVTMWPTYLLHPTPMALEKEQRMGLQSDKRLDPTDWGTNFLRRFLQLVETADCRDQKQLLATELERAVNRRMRQNVATDKNFITIIDLWDVLHLSLTVRLKVPRGTVRRRMSTLGARDGSLPFLGSSQLGASKRKHSEASTGASLTVRPSNMRQGSEAYVASREQDSTVSKDDSPPSPICLDTDGEWSETSAELPMQEEVPSNRHDSHRTTPSHMSDDGAPPSLKAEYHAWIIKQVEEKARLGEEIEQHQHAVEDEERQIDERQNAGAEYRTLADEYQRKAEEYMRKAGEHRCRAEKQANEVQSLKRGLGERMDQIAGKRAKLETVKARLLAGIGV